MMKKGVIELANTSSVRKDLAVGESILAGVVGLTDFIQTTTVSVFDHSNREDGSLIAPLVFKGGKAEREASLVPQALKIVWEHYQTALAQFGKGDETEKYRKLVNQLKASDMIHFGLTDLESGEQVVLPLNLNTDPKGADKSGNKFYNGLKALEEEIETMPIKATKGDLGAWTIIPHLKKLTSEQKNVFDNLKEVPVETYESTFVYATEEKLKQGLARVGVRFNVDFSSLGITPDMAESKENTNANPFI